FNVSIRFVARKFPRLKPNIQFVGYGRKSLLCFVLHGFGSSTSKFCFLSYETVLNVSRDGKELKKSGVKRMSHIPRSEIAFSYVLQNDFNKQEH
ncbi:Uncharacterized protein APZ42_002918, partial [Daphnia magna]